MWFEKISDFQILLYNENALEISFFSLDKWPETITLEKFIPRKFDHGMIKARSRQNGMKRFSCNHRIKPRQFLPISQDPSKTD